MSDPVAEAKQAGNAAFSQGDFKGAIECFTRAIDIDETNHVLYSNRSAAHASLKDYGSALADADKVVSLKPDWAKGYSRKATALTGLRRFPEAREACQKGLEIDPENAQLKGMLASADAALRQYEQEFMQSAKMFGPDSLEKLRLHPQTEAFTHQADFVEKIAAIAENPSLLSTYMQQDQRLLLAWMVLMGAMPAQPGGAAGAAGAAGPAPAEEEEDDSAQAGSAPPEEEEAAAEEDTHMATEAERADELKAEGNALYRQRKFDEALAKYDEALQLTPDNILLRTNKAAVYSEMKEYERAIQECEEAIEYGRSIHADFAVIAKAFARIGNVYMKTEQYTEAIAAFNSSLTEQRTRDVLQRLKLAEKLQKEKAEREYLDPEAAKEAKEEGNRAYLAGKYPEAVAAYTEAIRRDPTDHTFYSNRSACYLKLLEFPLALADADKCIELRADFAKGHLRKGNAHSGLKEYHKALAAFEEGLKLDARNQELLQGRSRAMAQIQSHIGDRETQERAMQDPEIQAILSDPMFMNMLKQMEGNPELQREYLSNPEFAEKVGKLAAAGFVG